MLPLYALPWEIQKKAFSFKTGDSELADERAAKSAKWLAEQPEGIFREVLRRKAILEDWFKERPVGRGEATEARQAFAKRRGISPVTLYRWERHYKLDDLPGLAPGYGAKKGFSKLTIDQIDELLDYYLDKQYPHRTKAMAVDYHRLRCKAEKIRPVSASTIRRLLADSYVQILKYACIHGTRQAMDKFGPHITRTREGSYPTHCYIGDHYNIDVRVISPDRKRLVTGWLTAWEDNCTTMLVGHNVCFTPNSESIQIALLRSFEGFGICDIINTDNGKDYLSKAIVDRMILVLNLKHIKSIVKNARAKRIERGFKDWAARACPAMPGHRGRNHDERPDDLLRLEKKTLKAIKEGSPLGEEHGTLMTWEQLCEKVDHFVHWKNTVGSDGESMEGRSPAEVWESFDNPIRTVDRSALWMLWLPVERRRVQKCQVSLSKGVSFRNAAKLGTWAGRDVKLRYHPDHLDKVYVHHPETDVLICTAERVEKVPKYDPTYSAPAIKKLKKAKKEFKQAVQMERLARRKVRKLTFGESAGIDEPENLPPVPGAESHPTVPQLTALSRAAREIKAEEMKKAANAEDVGDFDDLRKEMFEELQARMKAQAKAREEDELDLADLKILQPKKEDVDD